MSPKQSNSSEWLLPESNGPLDVLAKSETIDYDWPVPVEAILQEHVEFEKIDWPHEIDALMLWGNGMPIKVLIRKRPTSYWRRERMTIAHELGHAIIPWHIGYNLEECHHAGSADAVDHVQNQEGEARSIAGKILIPHHHLCDLANGVQEVDQFFGRLDEFKASPLATIIRLKQVLRPGFVFYGDFTGDGELTSARSKGTGKAPFQDAVRDADRSGSFTVNGREIRWAQVSGSKHWVASSDPRTSFEVLKQLVSEVDVTASPEVIRKRAQTIQGKIGGGISHGTFTSIQDIQFQATQKARMDVEEEIVSHPLWGVYVSKTVEGRARRLNLI